jgi:hypothetical protein
MSSIIVKGMRMPENCEKCPFLIEEDIDYDVCRQCGAGKNGYIYEEDIDGFPADCPLVDLGKHGDLIDADELKKEFPKDTDWEYPVNTNEYVCETIDNAKTVIEAEEES